MPQLVQRVVSLTIALGRRESGQTMSEYGVILGVLTVGVLGALLAFSGAIQTGYQVILETMDAIL